MKTPREIHGKPPRHGAGEYKQPPMEWEAQSVQGLRVLLNRAASFPAHTGRCFAPTLVTLHLAPRLERRITGQLTQRLEENFFAPLMLQQL